MNAVVLAALFLGSPFWASDGPGSGPRKCATYQAKAQAKAGATFNPAARARYTGTGNPARATFALASSQQDGRSEKGAKAKTKGGAWTAKVAPGGQEGHGQMVVVQRKDGDEAERASQGWLGVSIGPVPESLAAQLGTESTGLLVLNVVEDSPADVAGIRPHDIIVSIGEEEVAGEVEDMVNLISERSPGERVNVAVLREGKEVRLNATLGSRADQGAAQFQWKIEGVPDAEVEDEVHTRGRFMFRDPQGEWIMRDLGDLSNLPDDVKMMLPESGSRSVQVFVENGETKVRTRVQRDGKTISVDRQGEGEITVTRTDAQGNETTQTYASPEELAKSDEEAHEILQGIGGGVYTFDADGLGQKFQFDFDVDGDFHAQPLQWDEHMQESLQRAQEAYERAMEEMHKLQGNTGPAPHKMFFSTRPDGSMPQVFGMRHLAKPKHSFEVRPDGTIEVRLRKGDSELVQLYTDEDDLARRAPELAEKYQELLDAGDE